MQKQNAAWLYVIAAGALEIVWASGLKYPAVPGALVVISLILSFDLLVRSARTLPVGTMYAVFTGIGTIGTVVVESAVSGAVIRPAKALVILLLLAFVIGLKLTTEEARR